VTAVDTPGRGLLLTSNLIFSSKVTGTAQALGFRVDVVGRPEAVPERLSAGGYRCLLVDLGTPGLKIDALLTALPAEGRPRVLAFGPHVEVALFEAARAAGCDEVLPHSRFSGDLPNLLRRELGDAGTA
jgi:hypothetical protein